MLTFPDLISPVSTEEFFRRYWEQEFLYLHSRKDGCYHSILTEKDLDRYFQGQNLPPSLISMIRDGIEIEAGKWTTLHKLTGADPYRLVSNSSVFSQYAESATLVINAAEMAIPSLTRYCAFLAQQLRFRVQANLYLTPSQAQGFPPHYDNHNVIILQIQGRKRWRLYRESEKLPLKARSYPRDYFKATDVIFEAELQPGDLLYLPRGLVHEAATNDIGSIHLTLGLHSGYWFDLLERLLAMAKENATFRQTLPHSFSSATAMTEFTASFSAALQQYLTEPGIPALLSRQYEHAVNKQPADRQAYFTDLLQLQQINLRTIVARRRGIMYLIEKDQRQIWVKFAGQELSLPTFLSPVLEQFLLDEPFAVETIKGLLSDNGRIELVRQFVQAGFLTIKSI